MYSIRNVLEMVQCQAFTLSKLYSNDISQKVSISEIKIIIDKLIFYLFVTDRHVLGGRIFTVSE